MRRDLRILLAEDSEDDAELLLNGLRRGGIEPLALRVDTATALRQALTEQSWDVVIADYSMPGFSGLEALRIVRESDPDMPFLIVSGTIGEETAVAAMRAGAHDYIMKDNTARLLPAIERELKEAEVRRERRRAENQIRYLAYHDPLTGLPNRVHFLAHLEDAIAAGGGRQPLALLVIDLNHFREINDTLGFTSGDTLLKEAAQRLGAVLGRQGSAARLGGDDFAVLLPNVDAQQAMRVADCLLESLAAPHEIGGMPLSVGARIGIALYPQDGDTARALLQHADVAMSTQHQGASSAARYQRMLDPYNPKRLMLMGELRDAIGSTQLHLHFQPKLNLRSGSICGAEALLRWQHPRRGAVPPDEFIPLAEKTGSIVPLTLHVLKQAVEQCDRWNARGRRLPVAVNLSVRDLLGQQLLDTIETMLVNRVLDAQMLELEITETVLMEDPTRSLDILTSLHDMGIALHLDDFGTGYSSLGYLKKLPIQAVKIDRSFVLDMIESRDAEIIVRSTIDLAHNLGLKVVAEGVERRDMLERLSALGCDEVQGYHICRPLPPADLDAFLAQYPPSPRPHP